MFCTIHPQITTSNENSFREITFLIGNLHGNLYQVYIYQPVQPTAQIKDLRKNKLAECPLDENLQAELSYAENNIHVGLLSNYLNQ